MKTAWEKPAWEKLIERYCPPDKQICNCRDAYYTLVVDGAYRDGKLEPAWRCEFGCQANKAAAREFVAKAVIKEFNLDGKPNG